MLRPHVVASGLTVAVKSAGFGRTRTACSAACVGVAAAAAGTAPATVGAGARSLTCRRITSAVDANAASTNAIVTISFTGHTVATPAGAPGLVRVGVSRAGCGCGDQDGDSDYRASPA